MTVIATLEFDDFIAIRKASGDADGTHRRFCTRVDHTDFFDRGINRHDELG